MIADVKSRIVADFRRIAVIGLVFAKIGLFTFGGGFAMVPLLEQELILQRQWLEHEDLLQLLTVAQTVPGSVSLNSATTIGLFLAGRVGAGVATVGVILPSFVIITGIAAIAGRFAQPAGLQAAFLGVRCGLVALIGNTAMDFGRVTVPDAASRILLLLTVWLVAFRSVNPIFAILLGAVGGQLLFRTGAGPRRESS